MHINKRGRASARTIPPPSLWHFEEEGKIVVMTRLGTVDVDGAKGYGRLSLAFLDLATPHLLE